MLMTFSTLPIPEVFDSKKWVSVGGSEPFARVKYDGLSANISQLTTYVGTCVNENAFTLHINDTLTFVGRRPVWHYNKYVEFGGRGCKEGGPQKSKLYMQHQQDVDEDTG